MKALLDNLSAYLIAGIVIVMVVSSLNRVIGAVLGMIFWAAVAWIGTSAYALDGAIGIGSVRFSQTAFYALCAVMVAVNAALGFNAWRKRPAASTRSQGADEP